MVGKGSARQGSVYQSGGIANRQGGARHGVDWSGMAWALRCKGGGFRESRGPACRGGVRSGTARLGKVFSKLNRKL
jgi:hypothetical protein